MSHVLIVEDNDQLSRMYQKVLNHAGFKTLLVYNSQEAIFMIRQFDPDLICLDWRLESGNAKPVLEFLRSLAPEQRPKVLLISAQITKQDLEGYEDLVSAKLIKPVPLSELVWCAQAALRQTRKLALQHSSIKRLSPDISQITLVGRISEQMSKVFQDPSVETARTLVIDIRQFDVMGLNGQTPEVSLTMRESLVQLQRVLLVYHSSNQSDAHYFAETFIGDCQKGFYHSLDQALHDAIIGA
jgi:DNA-binding response OmpR family regulator